MANFRKKLTLLSTLYYIRVLIVDAYGRALVSFDYHSNHHNKYGQREEINMCQTPRNL